MMLNSVDLPQPDGPITAKNSPGFTASDTLSTAVSTPSGVSNCLTMPSTVRIGSTARAAGTASRPNGIATTDMDDGLPSRPFSLRRPRTITGARPISQGRDKMPFVAAGQSQATVVART